MMKKWFVATMMALAIVTTQAGESRTVVLTSLEVVQALGEALTENTSIQVENVIPPNYAMRGQQAYLKKHQKVFLAKADKADAVLTLGSVWQADPLYQWARRGNIRVVNIDVAYPLDGYGAGVPLLELDGTYTPYVWRSPANLMRMAAIAAQDLERLVPSEAETIRYNLKKLQSTLFVLRSKFEMAFLELDSVSLAALTARDAYLTDEFGLNVHFYFLKPEDTWSERDMQELSARLKNEAVKGVLCPWEPEAATLRAIERGGSVPVVLKPFVHYDSKTPVKALVDWYDDNLTMLLSALQN